MARYPWSVLGLKKACDEKAIKSAYAKKLKETRPDDDPAGFQLLVDARDCALKMARARAQPSIIEVELNSENHSGSASVEVAIQPESSPPNISRNKNRPRGSRSASNDAYVGKVHPSSDLVESIANLLGSGAKIDDDDDATSAIAKLAILSIHEKTVIEPLLLKCVVDWLAFQNESLRNGACRHQNAGIYSLQKLAIIGLDMEYGWSENVTRLSALVPFSSQMTDELVFLRSGRSVSDDSNFPLWKRLLGIAAIFLGLYTLILSVIIPLLWKIYIFLIGLE